MAEHDFLGDIGDVLGFLMGREEKKESAGREQQMALERMGQQHQLQMQKPMAVGRDTGLYVPATNEWVRGFGPSNTTTDPNKTVPAREPKPKVPWMSTEVRTYFSKHPEITPTPENVADLQTKIDAQKKQEEAEKLDKATRLEIEKGATEKFKALKARIDDIAKNKKLSKEAKQQKQQELLEAEGYPQVIEPVYSEEGQQQVAPKWRKIGGVTEARRQSAQALTPKQAEAQGLTSRTINFPILKRLIKQRLMDAKSVENKARPLTAYQQRKLADQQGTQLARKGTVQTTGDRMVSALSKRQIGPGKLRSKQQAEGLEALGRLDEEIYK